MAYEQEKQRLEEDLREVEELLETLPAKRRLERVGLEARRSELKGRVEALDEVEEPPRTAVPDLNRGKVQIDIGSYEIFSGAEKVGELWVESDPNDSTRTTQHWCLFPNYVAPSKQKKASVLHYHEVTGLHASLQDFLAYVSARQHDGARYLKAIAMAEDPAEAARALDKSGRTATDVG